MNLLSKIKAKLFHLEASPEDDQEHSTTPERSFVVHETTFTRLPPGYNAYGGAQISEETRTNLNAHLDSSPFPTPIIEHLQKNYGMFNPALENITRGAAVLESTSASTTGGAVTTTSSSLTSESKKSNLVAEETIACSNEISSSDLESQQAEKQKLGYDPWTIGFFLHMQWTKMIGFFMICFGVIAVVIFGTVQAAKGLKVIEGDKSPSKHVYGTLSAIRTNLIDPDTPEKYHHKIGSDGKEWDLVFSDEFAMENRTFYPGDDQFWEAIQLHYAATDDKEYYDPDYVTTRGGSLRIRIDNKKQHDLNFTSGMLQGWNKMCFTQGYVETSIKQPGSFDSKGLWPAFWALGNLGRAGYMASTDGVWPYSYDSCDAGITANQSSADGLSFLPGQRLSSCTCKGEDHPSIGTARGAPEIDIMEGLHNKFAQSFNIAPFDIWKTPDYDFISIDNRSITAMNPFQGTVYQEAISALTTTNHDWFDFPSEGYKGAGHFHRFGMEYRSDQPNNIDNYINYYVNDQQSFRVTEGALHPDGNVGWRRIPKEPLSLILNLGLSEAWSKIDFTTIQLPTHFEIDYIRVYQPKDAISITCDPVDYPTTDYIKDHLNAYMNPNLTSWEAAGYEFPKNSLLNNCKV